MCRVAPAEATAHPHGMTVRRRGTVTRRVVLRTTRVLPGASNVNRLSGSLMTRADVGRLVWRRLRITDSRVPGKFCDVTVPAFATR